MDVSVIIPVYNVEEYLDQCLLSVEDNDEVALEIICVNDGSTDGSLAIMRDHAARDGRVRIIDKENEGYGASVNRGIAASSGTYVAIMEPDDFAKPHMYDRLFAFASSFGELPDVVKSAYWRIQDPDTPEELFCRNTFYRRVKPPRQPFTLREAPVLIQYHPSIWTALYLRSFLDEFGIRLREVPGAGWVDNPFMIDTLARARSIVYTDDCYYCYRDRRPGASTCGDTSLLGIERWNDMRDILDSLGETDPGIEAALDRMGMRHVGLAIGYGHLGEPGVREKVVATLRRMDPDIIAGMDNLSAGAKKRYFELTGYEARPYSGLAYYGYLLREFLYTARVMGVRYALSRMGVLKGRKGAA